MDFELFPSRVDAENFIKGFKLAVEIIDENALFISEPELKLTGEWQVTYGE